MIAPWKIAMLRAGVDSDYPTIYSNDGQISFDVDASKVVGEPVYIVIAGDDGVCGANADQVTCFLTAKGVDASKFR